MSATYLLVNGGSVIVPFLFSFHPKLQFYRHWRAFFIANFLTAAAFIAWDTVFTALGVWGFNPRYVTGLYFGNLPVEECLFFICIPYACVFTYHCLNLFYAIRWSQRRQELWVLGLSAFLLLFAGIFYDRLYTFYTFTSLSVVLLVLHYILKINWMGKILAIYPVLLIPFFIVNGILTGTGLDEPVVWYDNTENMGFRLGTIPFEDVFYGLELILLNIAGYEYLGKKSTPRSVPGGISGG